MGQPQTKQSSLKADCVWQVTVLSPFSHAFNFERIGDQTNYMVWSVNSHTPLFFLKVYTNIYRTPRKLLCSLLPVFEMYLGV